MLFLIFLVSILTLEGILRYDEAAERKATRQRAQRLEGAPAESPTEYPAETPGLLTLAKAIEQHNMTQPSLGQEKSGEQQNSGAQRPRATPNANPLADQPLEGVQGR